MSGEADQVKKNPVISNNCNKTGNVTIHAADIKNLIGGYRKL